MKGEGHDNPVKLEIGWIFRAIVLQLGIVKSERPETISWDVENHLSSRSSLVLLPLT